MHRTVIRCLLLVLLAAGTLATHSAPSLAAKSASGSSSSRSKYAYHQFTGIVTALDKTSLTVEKRGKQVTSRTFARHEGMSTSNGELVRDARITVYYRDEGGKAVAHKVVVKAAPSGETASN